MQEKIDLMKNKIYEQLKTCFDPEISVNVVDLGLIYDVDIEELSDKNLMKATIKMTLTNPGCAMGDWIISDIEEKVKSIDQIDSVNIELVWDPPWDQSMMSEAARLTLGLM